MRKIEIIPAMDIIDGRCVRLVKGDYSSITNYDTNPLDQALKFEELGFKSLHLVDLDGAKGREPVNLSILEQIAANTSLVVEFGGGIKSLESARKAFKAGAGRVVAGSICVTNPELVNNIIKEFGPERVVLGVDIIDNKIAINGWVDRIAHDIKEFISFYKEKGISRVVCTDISKDGMMSGPSADFYLKLTTDFPDLNIIASGGITSLSDLELLSKTNIGGAIVGKALYEGFLKINDIKKWLQNE